jgi:hypothetical protein
MLDIDYELGYDFTESPKRNLDFFIPLSLHIDPAEYEMAQQTVVANLRNSYNNKRIGHRAIPAKPDQWTKTLAICNSFLNPIGLVCNNLTAFISNRNQTAWSIHRDAYFLPTDPDSVMVLEARISFYELCEAPGALRMWNVDDIEVEMTRENTPIRANGLAKIAEDLRVGTMFWPEVPPPAFSSVTSCASALIRTERPHHIIQGNGFRYVISSTVTFANGNPKGVWNHLLQNLDRLGV